MTVRTAVYIVVYVQHTTLLHPQYVLGSNLSGAARTRLEQRSPVMMGAGEVVVGTATVVSVEDG